MESMIFPILVIAIMCFSFPWDSPLFYLLRIQKV